MTQKQWIRIVFGLICFALLAFGSIMLISKYIHQPKDDMDIMSDLLKVDFPFASGDVTHHLSIESMHISDRRTEGKTDTVHCYVFLSNGKMGCNLDLTLRYIYYSGEGWVLDEVIHDPILQVRVYDS